jgi:hypothetical protein
VTSGELVPGCAGAFRVGTAAPGRILRGISQHLLEEKSPSSQFRRCFNRIPRIMHKETRGRVCPQPRCGSDSPRSAQAHSQLIHSIVRRYDPAGFSWPRRCANTPGPGRHLLGGGDVDERNQSPRDFTVPTGSNPRAPAMLSLARGAVGPSRASSPIARTQMPWAPRTRVLGRTGGRIRTSHRLIRHRRSR